MCCAGFSKKIIPFFITFTLGLFAAGIFYSVFSSAKTYDFEKSEKSYKHKKTDCGFSKKAEKQMDIYEVVPEVPVAPPPPPAPPVAPAAPEAFENTLFPPTPPETIILREELEKKNK